MALYQRISPARGNGKERDKTSKGPVVKQLKTKYGLLVASEVPEWYAHNSFLHTGYRPVNGSVWLCVNSLRSLHNETDRLAVQIYLITSLLCFGISSLYHTLNCHSESYSGLWTRWDYAAIILQTVGCFISGIYCNPGLQKLYWTMGSALRISTFVATGLSGLLPVIHAASVSPLSQLNQQAGLGYYLLEGLTLIVGTVIYAKFDIWGASHQIFHIFVVLSAAIHIWGILSVYDWIYDNLRCFC
ncbi:adiponectin receptor protein [Xylaria venustula]|nr:adiponectin receptor protein [Xylaria venustula]